jgi:glycosyltransferase involved in cell wall biosynthesis
LLILFNVYSDVKKKKNIFMTSNLNSTGIRFIHMDPVNFQDFPMGGTLSFSRQLIDQFRDQVALVGMITDESEPVGRWFRKEISGVVYHYFGIGRFRKSDMRPIIPIRLKTFLLLLFYLRRIRKINISDVFTQSPQFLFALNFFNWDSLCFCFAGIANSVAISRYTFLRVFGILYEKILFRILKKKATVILAAADNEAILDAITRTGNILKAENIISFPTRFNPKVFYPTDKTHCRESLNINNEDFLLVTTGRLGWVKGWQLLIDATAELFSDDDYKNIKIVFIGDGEDKKKIENYNKVLFEKGIIKLVGKLNQNEISLYLNAADVFVFGSFTEGWPTSLVEAMACGCSIVTTNVSAVSEIVYEGKNGFIENDRDSVNFAKMIKEARKLKNVVDFSLNIRNKFSVEYLKDDLERLWLSRR